jgi:hypothetical protein
MKKYILIGVLLFSAIGYSQNSINYKALIKDDLGNAIVNSSVDIKFQILESGAQTNIYEETHSPTTDINGIIIVNIGEGTIISGIFNDINWEEDEHFLNVKIDSGSGFVNLGTVQFSAVPYAFHAKKAANVKGLEPIDEGNGIGWRLVDRNANNHDNIGFNAIDFSFVDDPTLGSGATGNYSFSLGHNGTASGEHALAFGNQNYSINDYAITLGNNNNVSGLNSTAIGGINQVSGDYAFAAGLQNIASEDHTIALGNATTASGEYAVAMGQNTTASGESSTAFGRNAEATGDRSVAMGSGAEAQGDFSFAFGDESEAQGNNSIAMGNDAFATNDDAIAIGRDAFASGQSSFAVGSNSDASGDYSTSIGQNTRALGINSTALGFNTIASGNISGNNASTAMGSITVASGFTSTSMGSGTVASGSISTSMGSATRASGSVSTALGIYTLASGSFSTAMGNRTIAPSYAETVIGAYNTTYTPNGSLTWDSNDRLFVIGNGNSDSRSNAMVILKNGNTGIGTDSPQELLHLSGGRLRIGDEVIEDGGNDVIAFYASLVPAIDGGDRLGGPNRKWQDVYAVNGTIQTSDRRSKTNIANLNYGLNEVLQMQPVSFNWKNKNNPDTKLGLIAQDLQALVPEVVHSHIWKKDEETSVLTKKELNRMGVYYSDLVPVLIKAIQEQQKIIDKQNTNYLSLLERVESLEKNTSN